MNQRRGKSLRAALGRLAATAGRASRTDRTCCRSAPGCSHTKKASRKGVVVPARAAIAKSPQSGRRRPKLVAFGTLKIEASVTMPLGEPRPGRARVPSATRRLGLPPPARFRPEHRTPRALRASPARQARRQEEATRRGGELKSSATEDSWRGCSCRRAYPAALTARCAL